MTLLTPLGLLGLLSVVALIIIYIIRPNYQQKFVSSTFVWKLALKRKKKRLPTSKLRNILLIICQVLILLSLTALLTTPSQPLEVKSDVVEVIAIVDTSASMRTKNEDNVSRFERALEKVKSLADEAFNNDGLVSLMFAGNTNKFVVEKVSIEDREIFDEAIDEALGRSDEESECTYGSGDLNEAILTCQEVLETNPSTQIYVYSDIDYGYVPKKDINYERIYDTAEGNLAVLNAYAEYVNNYYNFYFDVASYGKDAEVALDIYINGVNEMNELGGGKKNIVLQDVKIRCTDSQVTSLVICSKNLFSEENKLIAEEKGVSYFSLEEFYAPGDAGISNVFSFESISVQIDLGGNQVDSYSYDNSFNIYGGKKEQIKVQYVSTVPCKFMQQVLEVCSRKCAAYWDVKIDEKRVTPASEEEKDYAIEGYDIYFFEHKMPDTMPVDGIVVLIDPSPNEVPNGAGFKVTGQETLRIAKNFKVEGNHNIFGNVRVADIETKKLTYIKMSDDSDFKVIASVDNYPVIAVKEKVGERPVLLMGFDIHYTNFPILADFPIFMYNLYRYFLPPTVKSHAFEVYENVEINARSTEVTVIDSNTEGNMFSQKFDTFPAQVSFAVPGTYEIHQTTFTNKNVEDTIYVRCPMAESNIFEKKDALVAPFRQEVMEDKFKDLMFYFAIALAVLLFLEWFLQSRDNM